MKASLVLKKYFDSYSISSDSTAIENSDSKLTESRRLICRKVSKILCWLTLLLQMATMEEGDDYDSQSQAASRSTEQDGTEQTPSGCHSFLQSQFNGTNTVFGEIEQGFQPVSDRFFAGHNSYQENEQPAIKKFRGPELDETNDGEKDEEKTSLFSDDNAAWLVQCVPTRPQSPDCACVDPQFQAASLGLPVAHEQSFWSQDFTISGIARGRRRHAICEELDTTGRLQRNRSEESFNLGNISDELDILTNTSRKRKR